MWPRSWATALVLLRGASFIHAAINLDGTQAVDPVTEDDASPIADPNTYIPDQHDCPLPCVDYTNTHSWITYLSVDRLRRCKEPMLLQFSISEPLEHPLSTILIRSCTLTSGKVSVHFAALTPVENPKKSDKLVESSLDTAPPCAVAGVQTKDALELSTSGPGEVDGAEVARLLEGMQEYFKAKDNCDENFLFAHYKTTVASVFVGPGLGKPTIQSALETLGTRLRVDKSVSNQTVAQLCGNGRAPARTIGIFIDTTGDLAAVQRVATQWSEGTCAADKQFRSTGLLDSKVFDITGDNSTIGSNSTLSTNASSVPSRLLRRFGQSTQLLEKRATCRYVRVESGDGCAALVSRCKISADDFNKFNPKPNLCSTLAPGDYVCCSTGDPYTAPKPDPPKPGADGICATHLIKQGDTCDKLAKQFGVTVANLEKWNKGKTWAWTECSAMLIDYNMCLSDGLAPMPPPQQGTECGPLVPGTKRPSDKSVSLADLNPCPLKACCSNWGFCGVFPDHCNIHAPKDGGPGSKEKGFQNTCVSNCGMEIKQNSGPPASFQRIGYYESFAFNRECLWMKVRNANTDGTYTHIHWGFLEIDPKTWKPIINDPGNQWADFKKLTNIKRVVSFGGWAYSTEPATYNIIRSAIIENRDTFARNLAQFAQDEGIDGVDIDWEYPGAPDIYVGGQPIGKKTDGLDYLKFLTVLKKNMPAGKTVSIAAPASFWYLKAFPIDRITAVIDYIVYMTYDLHGQWDYGNPNSFDACPSGKCIRSHVNLTETRSSLAIITKAGAANNKIFVGEASYGRSFRMAQDGCWQPMCEFTGSKTSSDATPGRCTKTGGYLAYAEIYEILKHGKGRTFHDGASNSDILLYNSDYVSYMTPTTKDTRRADWKGLNFAGTIDWAVDLQSFTGDDYATAPDRPSSGKGCVAGEDVTSNTEDLCEHACFFGFCPESLCMCTETGELNPLPTSSKVDDVVAWDPTDVDLNLLCKFACKYGYCPEEVCEKKSSNDEQPGEEDEEAENAVDFYDRRRRDNIATCQIYKDKSGISTPAQQCRSACAEAIDQAKKEGRTTNQGCIGNFPLDKELPWQPWGSGVEYLQDHMLYRDVGLLDVGLQFIPGVGKVLDKGLDMAATAAQITSYVYPEGEDPAGAFEWWLSPCGGSELVPDDIKKVFETLNQIPDGVSSFKTPRNIPKGSGKKGDEGNPNDRAPRPPVSGGGKKGCSIPASKQVQRLKAPPMVRKRSCVNGVTKTVELIVTSIHYAQGAPRTAIAGHCKAKWTQPCYMYSSVISVNPHWATLTCPPQAATNTYRNAGSAVSVWSVQHSGDGWQDMSHRVQQKCQRDEYPPAYMLGPADPAFLNSGLNAQGQLVRWVPDKQNEGAGSMWKGACFARVLNGMSDREIENGVSQARNKVVLNPNKDKVQTNAEITVNQQPYFTITAYDHAANPLPEHGMRANPCWPSAIAPADPGFVLLAYDPWYSTHPQPASYTYTASYIPGKNGV